MNGRERLARPEKQEPSAPGRADITKEARMSAQESGGGKPKRRTLSSFSILAIILVVLAVLTILISLIPGSGVTASKVSDVIMAPVGGFKDAIDVCIFVLILGGFISTMNATGALDAGINALVARMHGNEIMLIPLIMILFSIGGTTFGMGEETVPLYFLLAATFVSAGFDSMVGAATVLLGAGCGVLGSTVNPFATGIAIDTLKSVGIEANQGIVIGLGVLLWFSSLAIAIFFVMRYARRIQADKGSTILSLQERANMDELFGSGEKKVQEDATVTREQRRAIIIFVVAFLLMVLGVVPWENFGITTFSGWSGFITGTDLGTWYFSETSSIFLVASILIAVLCGLSESEFVQAFVSGTGDMMSVVLVIALARSITVLMGATGLDEFILTNAANALSGVSAAVFAPFSYLIYCGLSFLIPSSSGMAAVSMPIMGPLAQQLGFSPEVMVQIFSAANGLINLFTPTCGFIMGGLAITRINYGTWLKWARVPIILIAVVSCVILTAAMLIL